MLMSIITYSAKLLTTVMCCSHFSWSLFRHYPTAITRGSMGYSILRLTDTALHLYHFFDFTNTVNFVHGALFLVHLMKIMYKRRCSFAAYIDYVDSFAYLYSFMYLKGYNTLTGYVTYLFLRKRGFIWPAKPDSDQSKIGKKSRKKNNSIYYFVTIFIFLVTKYFFINKKMTNHDSIDYDKILSKMSTNQPIFIGTAGVGSSNSEHAIGKQLAIVSPLNTDIRFSSVPQFNIKSQPGFSALMATIQLPENWNWANNHPSDNSEMKNKKKLIMKPGAQLSCGSCWAFSSASVIGDAFIASGKTNFNPKISATYIMACPETKQNQCGGGNPSLLFQTVAKTGVTSKYCIDYSWCINNELCSGRKQMIKAATSGAEDLNKYVNTKIPNCGCISNKNNIYYITEPVTHGVQENATNSVVKSYSKIIQTHIYQYGPVIAGYFVLSNFISGRFCHEPITKGVYFDTGIYDRGELRFEDTHDPQIMGGHAVAIVGWGVAKNIPYNQQSLRDSRLRKDVPFWYVRNSMGAKLGGQRLF